MSRVTCLTFANATPQLRKEKSNKGIRNITRHCRRLEREQQCETNDTTSQHAEGTRRQWEDITNRHINSNFFISSGCLSVLQCASLNSPPVFPRIHLLPPCSVTSHVSSQGRRCPPRVPIRPCPGPMSFLLPQCPVSSRLECRCLSSFPV